MRYKLLLCLILAAYLLVQVLGVISQPLHGDEGIYSIAIKEFQKNGIGAFPTFYGEYMTWKPPLMFAVYAVMTAPLLPYLPEEIAFRIPSLLLTTASAVLLYLIGTQLLDEKRALLAVAIFLASFPVLGYGGRVITEPLTFLFTLIAISGAIGYVKNTQIYVPLLLIAVGVSGATMSKSISSGILAAVLANALVYFEKKPLTSTLLASGAALAVAAMTLHSYLLVTDIYRVSFIPNLGNMLTFANLNLRLVLLYVGPLSISFWLLVAYVINEKRFTFIDFWAASILLLLFVKIIATLPWYTIYFLPGIAFVIARQAKSKIDMFAIIMVTLLVLGWSLIQIPTSQEGGDMAEISGYITTLGENRTLIISRLGEVIANKAYVLKNAALVFPENGVIAWGKDNEMHYMGIRDKVATEDNLRGLIYDYGNPAHLPKFIDMMNDSERYYAPIGRTRANFTGPFEIIVAEDAYASIIEKVAPEYEKIYTTENEVYSVFRLKRSDGSGK